MYLLLHLSQSLILILSYPSFLFWSMTSSWTILFIHLCVHSRCLVTITLTRPVRKGQKSLVWLSLLLISTVLGERGWTNTPQAEGRVGEEREHKCLSTPIIGLKKETLSQGHPLSGSLLVHLRPSPAQVSDKSLPIPHATCVFIPQFNDPSQRPCLSPSNAPLLLLPCPLSSWSHFI